MKTDTIQISILDDGTIKIETDKVSMPNHANAEEFLKIIADMAGGGETRARKHDTHHHHHAHEHEHH